MINNPQKHLRLGKEYYFEGSEPKDPYKGLYHLIIAAKLNDVEAQFDAGVAYYKGKHIPKDIILN